MGLKEGSLARHLLLEYSGLGKRCASVLICSRSPLLKCGGNFTNFEGSRSYSYVRGGKRHAVIIFLLYLIKCANCENRHLCDIHSQNRKKDKIRMVQPARSTIIRQGICCEIHVRGGSLRS